MTIETKPDIGMLIGIGLIKEIYNEGEITEQEYELFVKNFKIDYLKSTRYIENK
jgi:hypothetical protein